MKVTKLELLLDEAKAKKTECLKLIGEMNAKADAFQHMINSIDRAINTSKSSNTKHVPC